jgi:peptidoglycan/LPS O-acetylase OafA/YrhL
MNKQRIHNLDYLRGLAALGIMVYHFHLWGIGDMGADTVGKKVGFYGVSIFYVLSGLTLYHVYFSKLEYKRIDIIDFFIKRIFRIFPLLWVTIVGTLILVGMRGWLTVLLNITGLFGIFKWNDYIGTGVWSIGNELVFYLFFPVLLFLLKKQKILFTLLGSFLFGFYVYTSFYTLAVFPELNKVSWSIYINPLNQIFLFLSGILIGHFTQYKYFSQLFVSLLLLISLLIFVFYPVYGEAISLIKGTPRMVYTILCIIICFCFYKLEYKLPTHANNMLGGLGEISYGLYLLHPLVWKILEENNFFNLPVVGRFILAGILSIIISYIVYQKFEKYFISIGRRVTKYIVLKSEQEIKIIQ